MLGWLDRALVVCRHASFHEFTIPLSAPIWKYFPLFQETTADDWRGVAGNPAWLQISGNLCRDRNERELKQQRLHVLLQELCLIEEISFAVTTSQFVFR